MKLKITSIIKLGIAGLLLLCLVNMPYGFYQLVRYVAMVAFAYFSYEYFKDKHDGLVLRLLRWQFFSNLF